MGVVSIEERRDGGLEGCDVAMDASFHLALAEQAKKRSTWLIQDAPVGVWWTCQRGRLTSQSRIIGVTGATSVYVTHDQVEALAMATHVAVMKDGRVEQFGTPDELLAESRTAFVATFVGSPPANLVPAERAALAGVPGPAPPDGALLIYRAERLELADADGPGVVSAEVAEFVPVAGRTVLTAMAGDLRRTAVIDGSRRFAIGEPVRLRLPERPDAVFDPNGDRLP